MSTPVEKPAAYIDARAHKHPQEPKIDVRTRKYTNETRFGGKVPSRHAFYLDPKQALSTNVKKLKTLAVKIASEGHVAVHIFLQYTNGYGDRIQQEYTYFSSPGKSGYWRQHAEMGKQGRSNILFRAASGAPVTRKNLKNLQRSRK
jgi:hypothetical protein